jgi:hypothetical protein
MIKKRFPAAGAALVLAFLAVTVLVPAEGCADVIHGCIKKVNGQVRIVPEAGRCLKSEQAVALTGTTQPNPAPYFEGELCWSIASEQAVMRLTISHTGDGHYSISGRITASAAVYSPVHGAAVLDGNTIYLTLVDSGKDRSAMWVGITHAVLDRYTLNGTAEGIGHERRYADTFFEANGIYMDADTRYGSSPFMTLIGCPRK